MQRYLKKGAAIVIFLFISKITIIEVDKFLNITVSITTKVRKKVACFYQQ